MPRSQAIQRTSYKLQARLITQQVFAVTRSFFLLSAFRPDIIPDQHITTEIETLCHKPKNSSTELYSKETMASLRKDNAAFHDAVPDLMASSSSLSVGDISKSRESKNDESFYHSCSSDFHSSFKPCYRSQDNSTPVANVHPAFLNSGFFRKKQNRAATQVQAVFRGFLVRFLALKTPLGLELDDVYKRKEEELERIEIQKHDLMDEFRKEMKVKLQTLEQMAEDHSAEVEYLKRETAKYEEENRKLEIFCKQLKKANKRLKKDVKKDEMHDKLIEVRKEVASLQIWNTSAEGEVQKYVAALDDVLNRLERTEEKCCLETRQKIRTHDCISDIINTVDFKDGALAKRLRKIQKKGVVTKTKSIATY